MTYKAIKWRGRFVLLYWNKEKGIYYHMHRGGVFNKFSDVKDFVFNVNGTLLYNPTILN